MEINGKPVVDATEPLHITISERDAALGKTKDPGKCAAARCIVRTIADAKAARVHLGRTYVEKADYWVRYMTPTSLRIEIVSFDRGAVAKYTEGHYTLPAPSPTARLDYSKKNPREARAANKRKNHHRRPHIARVHHQIEGVRPHGANK